MAENQMLKNKYEELIRIIDAVGFYSLDTRKLFTKKVIRILNAPKLKLIKTSIHEIIRNHIVIESSEAQSPITFVIKDDIRADHSKYYNNVIDLFPNAAQIRIFQHKRNKKIQYILSDLFIATSFFLRLLCASRYKVSLLQLLSLAVVYASFRSVKLQIDQIMIDTNCIVFYHDADPIQNLFCQFMNQRGINTATLQHGLFNYNPENLHDSTDISCIAAKYFLVWGENTRSLIHKCDPEIKTIIVGHPQFINFDMPERDISNCFGVLLGGITYYNENCELIKLASVISKVLRKRFIVKLHPADYSDRYDQLLKRCEYFETKYQNIDLFDYVKLVDFSVSNPSSSIIQMLWMRHMTYQYASSKTQLSVPDWMAFRDTQEFLKLYHSNNHSSQTLQLLADTVNNYIVVGDISVKYYNALNNIK